MLIGVIRGVFVYPNQHQYNTIINIITLFGRQTCWSYWSSRGYIFCLFSWRYCCVWSIQRVLHISYRSTDCWGAVWANSASDTVRRGSLRICNSSADFFRCVVGCGWGYILAISLLFCCTLFIVGFFAVLVLFLAPLFCSCTFSYVWYYCVIVPYISYRTMLPFLRWFQSTRSILQLLQFLRGGGVLWYLIICKLYLARLFSIRNFF